MPVPQPVKCNLTWPLQNHSSGPTTLGLLVFEIKRPAVASRYDLVNCIRRFLPPMRSGTVFRWQAGHDCYQNARM